MNYWIEDIENSDDVEIKLLRYRHDVYHELDDSILTAEEVRKYESYKSKKRQLEFYFTRFLWKSFSTNFKINYKSTGKPFIKEGYLSISHSHDCIAIAYSKSKEMGLDIEPISEKINKVKHKFSHPKENFETLIELTKSWCIKEAVYKLLDMDDVFFMDDIFVNQISAITYTTVLVEGEEILSTAEIIELPNKMILALAY